MRIVQFKVLDGTRRVGVVIENGDALRMIEDARYVYHLALAADRRKIPLEELLLSQLGDEVVDYNQVVEDNRLIAPLDHPDPARLTLSGTGLDHLGSAQARDAMHTKLEGDEEELTDSMKMFKRGLEGGKPAPGEIGSEPEWFYKGDGSWVVPPGHALEWPPFALDGGEEPELVGLYVISERGQVLRVGFALGNEYSDHVLEKQNYLYLAHSKLRQSSFGPELLLGEAPKDIRGTSRIIREGKEVWSGEFLTGEANMTHTIANIEHHHFKYAQFRRPGDVHCHFFGTATLSFANGIATQSGDRFEISASEFGRPLENTLQRYDEQTEMIQVKDI